MHFLFNRENHRADLRMSFDDITSTLGAQLVHFGHTWEINDKVVTMAADAVNVLFEGFSAEAIDVYAQHVPNGARYVCIATEQPTAMGEFNFGMPDHMKGRQPRFVEACARLKFLAVWALVAGDATLAWYRQHCANVAYLPIGFAPGQQRRPGKPQFDFGMYGSIQRGGRRWQTLERLHEATGASVHILGAAGIVPVEERDREMQKCRVLLQIRPNDASELVSSSRIAASLHAGRCVVAEYHKLHEPYSRIVRFAKVDNFASFVQACQAALRNWRREYALQLQRFQTVLSPEATMGPALAAVAAGAATHPLPAIAPAAPGGTLVATAVWGDDVKPWLRHVLPRLAGVPRLRVYTSDEDVRRLVAEPAIQELGASCEIDLRGVAPAADAGVLGSRYADVIEVLRHVAVSEAAGAGQQLTFLSGDTVMAACGAEAAP